MARLGGLIKRISWNTDQVQRHDNVIRHYIIFRHAQAVQTTTEQQKERPMHYMLHKNAVQETWLEQLFRVVFYASYHAPACTVLNDCLDTESKLNAELLEALLQFSKHGTVIPADLEQASL